MLKRVILVLMILAMIVSLISGCASASQEESASAGEMIEGSLQDDAGDQTDDFEQDKTPENPSDDNDIDNDQEQDQSGDDKEPAPDENDSDKEPAPEKDDSDKDPEPDKAPADSDDKDSSDNLGEEEPESVDPDAEDSGWYKIASYNIKSMWYDPVTRKTGFDQRRAIADILREIDADIVGLQEVDDNSRRTFNVKQAQWLAEELGYEYYRFTKTTTKDGGDYGHAILSRFPIKKTDEVLFKDQHPGSSEARKYTKSILEIDGKNVAFYNAHLCTQEKLDDGSRDSTYGQAQFREIAASFKNEKIPALMTGDFNLPVEIQHKLLDRTKMVSMNGGEDFKHVMPDGAYFISIDNIYVNKMMDYYVDARGMSVFVSAKTASDHKPLWSYFKIK